MVWEHLFLVWLVMQFGNVRYLPTGNGMLFRARHFLMGVAIGGALSLVVLWLVA
jgi:hypothetical protein